jgi:hypothetical protein
MTSAVVVFTTPGCPYCKRAKQALKEQKVSYKVTCVRPGVVICKCTCLAVHATCCGAGCHLCLQQEIQAPSPACYLQTEQLSCAPMPVQWQTV